MSVGLQCSRCGLEMHSSGLRGLCPRCLFACTTVHPNSQEEARGEKSDATLTSGDLVGPDNRFLLLGKLGEGGMGEVWLANDQVLSQDGEPQFVALKFLSNAIRHNKRALAALRTEVLRTHKLAHPNIVRLFELHTTRAGTPFIKMEFVEGNSLSQWLQDQTNHLMPWRMVVHVVQQLAGALQYAHQIAGIVHRDLKPANLLLAEGGVIKLSDFGIAQPIANPDLKPSREELVGTLAYASPQQLAGANAEPADDIYALGATLYELLTGTPPFQAETADELIFQIKTQAPQLIPQRLHSLNRENEVPSRLLVLVQRCLEKNPLDRPKAGELIKFLPPLDAETLTGIKHKDQWENVETSSRNLGNWFWSALFILFVCGAAAWLLDIAATRARVNRWTAWSQNWIAGQDAPPAATPTTNAPVSRGSELVGLTALKTTSASATNSPVVSVEPTGRLELTIKSSTPYSGYNCEIIDVTGTVVLSQPVGQTYTAVLTNDLPIGSYTGRVSVARGVKWVLQRPFLITPGATTQVSFPFRRGDLVVKSVPSNVTVYWRTDASQDGDNTTPFERMDIKAGNISLHATHPGYRLLQTNYFFEASPNGEPLLLTLERASNPKWGEDWVNSIGMEFKWVQDLRAWVATTETRVKDYRQFVTSIDAGVHSTVANPSKNAFSLTTKGWEQKGDSWENPGFPQSDDHPVVMVNWHDAMHFCEWLRSVGPASNCLAANQYYTLPSTNEWMVVAGSSVFPWGAGSEPRLGNYAGVEVATMDWPPVWPRLNAYTDPYPRTASVRTATPSKSGFYYLGGNAAEWCLENVLCGASWFDGEDGHLDCLRTSAVRPEHPLRRDPRNGFRLLIKQTP